MYAFVIDSNLRPLAPCHPARSRQLLDSGKASVYRRMPFVIVINRAVEDVNEQLRLKIDPGSRITGLALQQGQNIIWAAEIAHRGSIVVENLTRRASLRRGRRCRKTRYRPPRWRNRKRPAGWIAPSMHSRVENIMTWIARVRSYAPVSAISLERVKFDTQLLVNPDIAGEEYQQGPLYETEVREFLLHKYNHTCVYCGARPAVRGTIEHIIPRSKGGSNSISNLAWACYACNQKRSNQPLVDFIGRSKADQISRKARDMSVLRHAAAVNIIRDVLADRIDGLGLSVEWGTGGRTAYNRKQNDLHKAHWIDAACVGRSGECVSVDWPMHVLEVSANGHALKGRRQMQTMNKYGFPRSKAREPIVRRQGFQTGDLVRAKKINGKYAGEYVTAIAATNKSGFEIRPNGNRVSISRLDSMELLQRADGYRYNVRVDQKRAKGRTG